MRPAQPLHRPPGTHPVRGGREAGRRGLPDRSSAWTRAVVCHARDTTRDANGKRTTMAQNADRLLDTVQKTADEMDTKSRVFSLFDLLSPVQNRSCTRVYYDSRKRKEVGFRAQFSFSSPVILVNLALRIAYFIASFVADAEATRLYTNEPMKKDVSQNICDSVMSFGR